MYERAVIEISLKENKEILNTDKIGIFASKVNAYFDENRIISGATFFKDSKSNQLLMLDDENIQLTQFNVKKISDFIQLGLFCCSNADEVFGIYTGLIDVSFTSYYSVSYGKKIISEMVSIPQDLSELASSIKPDAIGFRIQRNNINYALFIAVNNRGISTLITGKMEVDSKISLETVLTDMETDIETHFIPNLEQILKARKVKGVK